MKSNLFFLFFLFAYCSSSLQAQSCTCVDYIYLNDIGLDYVEKFEVNGDGSLSEIGSPWLDAGSIVPNPHGIGADQNGFLYIGTADAPYSIKKFTCDGTQVDADTSDPDIDEFTTDGFSYNHFTIGNYLYAAIDGTGELRLYDLCDGSLLGCQAAVWVWGLTEGPNDGYWYGTNEEEGVIRGPLDPSSFTTSCNTTDVEILYSRADIGLPAWNNVSTDDRPLGIAFDDVANMYLTISSNFGFDEPSRIMKINPNGNTSTSLTDNTDESDSSDNLNWAGARGIVWSEASNTLYVSTAEDCVAAFDTSLVYLPNSSVHIEGDYPKGIGLLTECCPNATNVVIDTILCNAAINETVFLQNIISCDGVLCEGMWTEGIGNTGLTYNECNNSITINAIGACGSFVLESDGTGNNPQCGAFKITVNITINSLDLTVTQTSCVDNTDGTFTANYDAVINWNSEPCEVGEMINVTHNGVSIGMIDPSIDSSPSTFPVAINADGNGTNVIKAVFSIAGCSDSTSFKTPLPCPNDVATCASTSGCLGGNVFEDFNCNGADDTNEPGVQGIEIQIYDCNNALIGTAYSDSEGDWQLCGLTDGTAYRVEFVLPESVSCWATPTHVAGGGNQSDVQFLTAPACTQFSVSSPADYCQENPFTGSAGYVNGAGSASYNGYFTFDYNSSGTEVVDPYVALFTTDEVGSIWGTAYQKTQDRLFTSTFLKRHVGYKDGLGYIYYFNINKTTGALDGALSSFNLQGVLPSNAGSTLSGTGTIDLGIICRDASCGNTTDNVLPTDPTAANIDLDAFAKAGAVSFGDIEMENDSILWAVNINSDQASLISIDVKGANPLGTVNRYLVNQMNNIPSCSSTGELRIWGLTFHKGRGYLGAICDASISQDRKDLKGYVLSFDPQKMDQGFNIELTISDFDYNLYSPSTFLGDRAGWFAWANSQATIDSYGFKIFNTHAQPLISDIEFTESGDMIIGISDRYGLQTAGLNYIAESGTSTLTKAETYANGIIVKACKSLSGYALEGTGTCPTNFLVGTDGPGSNGEFFDNSRGDTEGWKGFSGGIAILKGKGELLSAWIDPFPPGATQDSDYFNSQGFQFMNTQSGTRDDYYRVYQSSGSSIPLFGKGNGLGDVELYCDPAPLEIGNYVWCDSLNNGIQDACERGINNILVSLYDRNGVLVGQDTTSNAGQYYFNQNNVDTTGITVDGSGISTPASGDFTGMSYNTQYFIVFGDNQFAASEFNNGSETFGITSFVNTGSNDNIDSDVDGSSLTSGSLGTRPDGLPFIELTTSTIGCGDHKYDLGLTCCAKPILTTLTNESICEDDSFTTTNLTTSETAGVSVTYQWFDNNGTDNSGVAIIAGQSTAILTALPTTAGSYAYRVIATNTADISCTAEQTVNLVINPVSTVTAAITAPTCSGSSTANTNGAITLSGFTTETYDMTTGSTYTGSVTSNTGGTAIPAGGIITSRVINPSGSQDYTIRIFNSDECYVDRIVTFNEVTCCPTKKCLPVNITIKRGSRN